LILIKILFIVQLDRLLSLNVSQILKMLKIIKIILLVNNNKMKSNFKLIKYH
jgi:hypothetical protein